MTTPSTYQLGNPPLKYSTLPSVTVKRDPTTADLRHPTVGGYYTIPTIWSNPLNEKVFVLVSITGGNTANWREVSQGGIAIPVTVPNGGTGLTSLTSGGIILGNGVNPVTVTAQPTDGQLLIGVTGSDPVLNTLTPGSNISITNGPGSITIDANGGGILDITFIDDTDSPYTVVAADEYISADVSSGTISIELEDAPTTGRVIRIKDSAGNALTNNISVTTVGGVVTIDGLTTYVMNTDYQSISLIFNGTSYEVF